MKRDDTAEQGRHGAAEADRQKGGAELRVNLLRQAVGQQPRSAELLYQLSDALSEAGSDSESALVFRKAFLLKPRVCPSLEQRQGVAPEASARRLRDRAGALIANGAIFSPVIGALAEAEALLGCGGAVRRLVDFDRFFRFYKMPLPGGASPADFIRDLAAEVRSDLKFYDEPANRAIRKAWRNNGLFSPSYPLSWSLVNALRDEVKRYIQSLPSDPSHPFLASRPADFVIQGWGVVSSQDSHHRMHIHEKAWMSGVYYVVRPPVSREQGSHRGWLCVGPPDGVPASAGWDSRMVEPEPGALVLMPGYFYHGTRPMGVNEERICIAFDVVPAEIAAGES